MFKEILGKYPIWYSKMQISGNFKIITLNWVRISETLMETDLVIHKVAPQGEAKQESIT